MSVYTKLVRVFPRFCGTTQHSFGKFLNGNLHVQDVQQQMRRKFHLSPLSSVFAKEIFVGNFVKVIFLHFATYLYILFIVWMIEN